MKKVKKKFADITCFRGLFTSRSYSSKSHVPLFKYVNFVNRRAIANLLVRHKKNTPAQAEVFERQLKLLNWFPGPFLNFWNIIAVCADEVMMILQGIIHLLNKRGSLFSVGWHMLNNILGQVVTVKFVEYPHVKWCGNVTFFTIAVNQHIAIRASEEDVANQPFKACLLYTSDAADE